MRVKPIQFQQNRYLVSFQQNLERPPEPQKKPQKTQQWSNGLQMQRSVSTFFMYNRDSTDTTEIQHSHCLHPHRNKAGRQALHVDNPFSTIRCLNKENWYFLEQQCSVTDQHLRLDQECLSKGHHLPVHRMGQAGRVTFQSPQWVIWSKFNAEMQVSSKGSKAEKEHDLNSNDIPLLTAFHTFN